MDALRAGLLKEFSTTSLCFPLCLLHPKSVRGEILAEIVSVIPLHFLAEIAFGSPLVMYANPRWVGEGDDVPLFVTGSLALPQWTDSFSKGRSWSSGPRTNLCKEVLQ